MFTYLFVPLYKYNNEIEVNGKGETFPPIEINNHVSLTNVSIYI